jgi:hypothetical protein
MNDVFDPASVRWLAGAMATNRVAFEDWSWMSSARTTRSSPALPGWPMPATPASPRAR